MPTNRCAIQKQAHRAQILQPERMAGGCPANSNMHKRKFLGHHDQKSGERSALPPAKGHHDSSTKCARQVNKESTRRQTGRGIPRGNPTESTEELLKITKQISTASATNGTRCGGVTQVTSALVTMRATDHRARGSVITPRAAGCCSTAPQGRSMYTERRGHTDMCNNMSPCLVPKGLFFTHS